jgi:hypothetical protein
MARKRIGELLLERKAITPEQLEAGLTHQKKTRQRLGVALIQLGFLTEDGLAQVLSAALNIPGVDLNSIQPEWAAIHMLRSRFCESHDLFPYALEQVKNRKLLLVAMSDPMDVPALEEIEFTTGLKVSPRVATLSAVRRAIMHYYLKINPDTAELDSKTMTVFHKGNISLTVHETDPAIELGTPGPPPALDAGPGVGLDEEVIEGTPLGTGEREITARTALADLIKKREQQSRERRSRPSLPARGRTEAADSLSKDLDFLFGVRDETNPVEALERKFWALMRLMAKKGLITKEEFSSELDEELD